MPSAQSPFRTLAMRILSNHIYHREMLLCLPAGVRTNIYVDCLWLISHYFNRTEAELQTVKTVHLIFFRSSVWSNLIAM